MGVIYALKIESVQTYVAQKATAYLSEKLNTKIEVKGLYIKPFSSVVLKGFTALDQQNDTLISTPELTVKIADFSIEKSFIKISSIQLKQGNFFIKSQKDGKMNFDFILNYFDSGKKTTPSTKPSKPFLIDLQKIELQDVRLRYKNLKVDTIIHGINYDDIDLKHFTTSIKDVDIHHHLFKAQIEHLSFEEKGGFELKNLTALTTIDTNQIELKNLNLVTPNSVLGNYFAMKYKSFADFSDFVKKVKLSANFRASQISSKDIAVFVPIPSIQKMNMNLKIDAEVNGTVHNLKVNNAAIKAGNATYINGNFSMKGLPDMEDTFLDCEIKSAGTNRKDLNEILGKTTGDKALIPDIVTKFGDVNFNGSFQGYVNDFVAYGDFKSKIGRASLDVNMKLDQKYNPSYSGTVKTYGFDIGKLIADKTIGKVTSSVYIKGSGTDMKSLNVAIKGKANSLYFNDYTYQNIVIDGTFKKKYFDGKVSIDDKYAKLVFDGDVNLQNALPAFRFNANIQKVNLRALHFYKDTLNISAEFQTNFSGTNLSNLAGDLMLKKIVLESNSNTYNIDSVFISAKGKAAERSLSIQSDLLEANVKGQFDLATIVLYYQSLAKKYIPSLNVKLGKIKPQIFQATVKIKNFEPVSHFLAKGLLIDNGATLVGDFNSDKDIATVNGFIKRLQYNDVVVNNIIIDENTTPEQMQAVITSDQIKLNDSSALKNLNISYSLKKDSLSVNVKLSDELDYNKVDLNGLVEFSRDSTAKVGILPSVLFINNEEWKIEDKADIRFGNGAIFIKNLQVGNKQQHISVNGAISDKTEDKLSVAFDKFSLTTINPILKAYNVHLKGSLNGVTNIYGVTKSLKVSDDLHIDSLTLNQNYIGNLYDISGYDHAEGLAKINTKIAAFGQENLSLTGDLNLKSKQLDLALKLKNSKLAIFEPFIKDILSNLGGEISSDIKVQGSFKNPNIQGDINLIAAQFKFNMLGVTYSITDDIKVDKSIIRFRGLKLYDSNRNLATVRGSVDLTTPSDPVMDINIVAKNFMALNTTERDNDLYYGKAFATSIEGQPIHIEGGINDLKINVNAKAEAGTVFNLPLNSAAKVSEKDFIIYLDKDTAKNVRKANTLQGIQMNFNLQVDQNSTMNVYTVLGKLSAQGNANLVMNINTLGDFIMNGEYVVESGKFFFSPNEIINKQFDIKRGGTIRWTGNPMDAKISNLNAVYEVRANLSDLYSAANRDANNNTNNVRIQTEVNLLIDGTLANPSPILGLNFPTRPGIKDDLQSYLSDQNNVFLQAVSLIVRKSFSANTNKIVSGSALNSGVNLIADQLTEQLFNQFTTAFNSLLNVNFLDVNIKSLADANASLKLWNGRVIVNGGVVNVSTASTSSSGSSISGAIGINNAFSRQNTAYEAEVSYLVKPDGNFITKLGYKPPIQQDITAGAAPTRSNVFSPGVVFSQQFDNFPELFHQIFGNRKTNTADTKTQRNELLNTTDTTQNKGNTAAPKRKRVRRNTVDLLHQVENYENKNEAKTE